MPAIVRNRALALVKGEGKKEISCRVSVQTLVWVVACVLKKLRNAFLRYDQEVRLRQARGSAEALKFFLRKITKEYMWAAPLAVQDALAAT